MDSQDVLISKLINNYIYKLLKERDLSEGNYEKLAGVLEKLWGE